LHIAQFSHTVLRRQLSVMDLTEVPPELFRMKNLDKLFLTNNKLCSLPSDIAHITTLEELRVRVLKRLDRESDQKSRSVQVDGNQLTSLPPELGLLINLKWLNVRHSRQIDHDLTPCHVFQVGTNQLTSLPAEIGQLTLLEHLFVRKSN
jgi:Leucine-rich repeat (LRR) protein